MPRRRYSRGYTRARRRKSGGGLTGGTGDVNPQWFNLTGFTDPSSGTAAATKLSAESIVPLQQQAMMGRGSKSMVMELLKVQYGKTAGTAAVGMYLILFKVVFPMLSLKLVLIGKPGGVLPRTKLPMMLLAILLFMDLWSLIHMIHFGLQFLPSGRHMMHRMMRYILVLVILAMLLMRMMMLIVAYLLLVL